MCGIFGALAPLPSETIDQVSRLLAHRGPDESGSYVDARVSLVHRRLRIIDLSPNAAQPMTGEDGTIRLVFNGEIYNHHLLRSELVSAGHHFRSASDTEVIVHGYEEWGDAVVERLDGMFAFGLWDANRQRMLLARDRTGKKPLFYTIGGEPFRFASTIEALGVGATIDLESLPYYLAYGFVPAPLTLQQGIRQLPPASRLLISPGGEPVVDQYWTPRFGSGDSTESFDVAKSRVRSLLESAVDRRLESDVPLGAFLSGGIDSSIIVGLMRRKLGRVRTFSIGFAGDPRYDETRYARLAAQAFDTEHTEFVLEPSSFELVETLVQHHDGPFGDSSAIPTYVVSKLTREHVTVALTGDGGDELFCGYERFLAAEAAERIPQWIRTLGPALAPLLRSGGPRSRLARAGRFLEASALPLADRMARWNAFFADPREIIRPELSLKLGSSLDAPLSWQRGVFAECSGNTTLAKVLEHNFRTYLPFDLLVKADRTSMAHGLELRSPFLDTALIEYASSLPPAYLRRRWRTKHVLKEAFRDLLPPEILTRGKMGFGVPLGAWFRGELRGYLNDVLGRAALLRDWLDPDAVDRLLDEHARGVVDHGQRLWLLLTLEVWLRQRARNTVSCAA